MTSEVFSGGRKSVTHPHNYVTCEGCAMRGGTLYRSPKEQRTVVTHWVDALGHRHQQTHHRTAYRHKACIGKPAVVQAV